MAKQKKKKSNLDKAYDYCDKQIRQLGLKMALTGIHYSPEERKITFFFKSDERVDFRELVKTLKDHLRVKIELRQIGARDEAKDVGGYGPCGRPQCCMQFLTTFKPINLNMAKEQGIESSPQKLTGNCGKLKCCLTYELHKEGGGHKEEKDQEKSPRSRQ